MREHPAPARPQETVTDIYLIILFFAFPLFPGVSGYANITFSKFVFLLAATGVWLAVLIFLLQRAHAHLPGLRLPQIAALCFWAVCLVSALASPRFSETLLGAGRFDGLLTLSVYILIVLGVSLFTHYKPLHLYALAASVTLCCLLAIAQLLGKNPLGLYPGDLRYADAGLRYSGVYLGTIGNMNLTDAWLCLTLPLFAVELIENRRWFLLVPILAALAVLLFAGGSGAALALCLTALMLPFVLLRKAVQRRVYALCALALLLAALLLLWFWPGTEGAMHELSSVLHGQAEDSFGSSRILIWRACLKLVPERPLLGGGPGTLPLRLELEFSRYVPETGVTLQSYVDNAHNVYLGYLVNTGALGLLGYLALLAACLITLLRRRDRALAAPALGLLCAALHAFFGLGLCLTEPMFFAMLALCCTTNGNPERSEEKDLSA